MDGYIFTDVKCLNSNNILAPNLWKIYFRMFELDDIMRQRESKMFAEILRRLREGKHTFTDNQKLRERCVSESNCPTEKIHVCSFKMLWLIVTMKKCMNHLEVINL